MGLEKLTATESREKKKICEPWYVRIDKKRREFVNLYIYAFTYPCTRSSYIVKFSTERDREANFLEGLSPR